MSKNKPGRWEMDEVGRPLAKAIDRRALGLGIELSGPRKTVHVLACPACLKRHYGTVEIAAEPDRQGVLHVNVNFAAMDIPPNCKRCDQAVKEHVALIEETVRRFIEPPPHFGEFIPMP